MTNLRIKVQKYSINNINIKIMTTECPNCGMENAYHDGVNYVCPDCDYEWDDGFDIYDDEDY
jgi:protein PhnA